MQRSSTPCRSRPVSRAGFRWLRQWIALAASTHLILAATPTAPWRLAGDWDLPGWLDLSGECRLRYSTLDGQFRAGRTGGDQVLALRTSLLAQFKAEPGSVVVELLDARHYGEDAGSFLDNTMVNPLDVLQAHVRWDARELIPGGTNTLHLGRETLDLGSRRLVARNRYRNTPNSFTGADWLWAAENGGALRAFYLLPVRRLPMDLESLRGNEFVADSQSFRQMFYGFYGGLPPFAGNLRGEFYYFRLQEQSGYDVRSRQLNTPGLRLFRPVQPGHWDFELESTFQFGASRLVADLSRKALEHRAHMQHLTVGYSLDAELQPRLGARYDYASGDADPADGDNGRFDALFGVRRFEFGPTGIYGAVPRANLNSPEYSLTLQPSRRVETTLSHRWLWLAEARDAWVGTGVQDPTGRAGNYLGHQLEFRVRWDVIPGNVRVDTGIAHLFAGDFLKRAPNSPKQGDINYAYMELTLPF